MNVKEELRYQRQQKARALRYQKPVAKELNFYDINHELWEIQEECAAVQWMVEDEDVLESAFDGDTDEAWEFRLMFADLANDCGRMRNDINSVEVWEEDDTAGYEPTGDEEPSDNVPNIFDVFFPAIDKGSDMYGFDVYEGDYYGLTYYECEAASDYVRKKLMRMTKEELLDAAGQCLRIARQYLAIKYRYMCIKSALDILRGMNDTTLKTVRAIEAAYEEADVASEHFKYEFVEPIQKFDQALRELQDRFWIE